MAAQAGCDVTQPNSSIKLWRLKRTGCRTVMMMCESGRMTEREWERGRARKIEREKERERAREIERGRERERKGERATHQKIGRAHV